MGAWEVPGPNANILKAGGCLSPRGPGEEGWAPQDLLVPKYLTSLKWHHESPLWFKTFSIHSPWHTYIKMYTKNLKDSQFFTNV